MRQILSIISVLGFFAGGAVHAQNNPVVVELYTSQGCSSCPPADVVLHDLAQRSDVIALALHVDYWDYIGWVDAFADPAFTTRQQAYARAANARTIYTPQMVIGGVDHVIGSHPMQVMDFVQTQRAQRDVVALDISRSGGRVQISAEATGRVRGPLVVQLVRYTPEETVAIRRGENAGRSISYSNIVNSWQEISRWDGSGALSLSAAASGNDPIVVIIQQGTDGPILAAAQLR